MFPVAASRLPVNRRRLGWIALACSAAGLTMGLTACGGGTRQSFFTPNSIVSFGDENSAFDTYAGALKKSDGTTGSGAMIKGLTYTVQSAVIGAPVVCNNTTTALPGTAASECTTSNGASVTSPTVQGYYGFTFFTSTKLEVKGANQRTTTTAYNCGSTSIWVQVLARAYGRGYTSQCALDTRGGAVSYAAYGAKTDDVINQIAAHRSELGSGVLVTIMVGQNDILEQFNAIGANTTNEAAAIATLQARADRMAAAVKDVIGTGAKVVLALTPSLNDAPRGVATNAALMSRLVVAYNDRLYVRGLGNVSGRDLVGVNPDSFTNALTRNRSYVHGDAGLLCNTTGLVRPDGTVTTGSEPDADANVRFCNTTSNLNGSPNIYMWADAIHYAPLGHSLIGSLAYNRARNQL